MKKIVAAVIPIFIFFSCQDTNNDNMNVQKDKNKEANTGSFRGYAPVNGLNMYYEIHGEGVPLVLIHGGGSTIQTSFGRILPFLAQHHKVIAVELQAHGHTADRDSPESFEQDARDVVALLAYLKIDNTNILGFSNGGQTAMQIGISYPQLVNKLIIISAFYKRDGAFKGFFEGMQNANLGNMPAPLKDAYLKIKNDTAGLQRMFERDKNRMLEFKDWRDEDVASIKAPSLIIAGDKDVVTKEHAVSMSTLIPNAQLMIVPGTHGSFIGEICSMVEGSKMPELMATMMDEFLRR